MTTPLPDAEPGEPSNRWPWIALAGGLLIVAIAVIFFFYNRQRTVSITISETPTAVAARAVSPIPPTLVPPTLPPSATLAPTSTPAASPTPSASPTSPPAPTAPPTAPPAPTQPTAAAAPPPPPPAPTPATPEPAAAQPPTATAALQPTPARSASPTPAATATPATPPSPTPFAGQVATAGGLGNTRPDFDAAYGAPAGETPSHLVVYRRGTFEYHVGFSSDPTPRATLLVVQPQAQNTATPFTIESAMTEAHRLLPRDAPSPAGAPEGNPQFVVERYTSQLLAQALPASTFTASRAQPGQFLAVYVQDPAQQTRIIRVILGPGADPQALISQGT